MKKWQSEIICCVVLIFLFFSFYIYMSIDVLEFRKSMNNMFLGETWFSDKALLIMLWFFRFFIVSLILVLVYGIVSSIVKEKRWQKYKKENIK